MLNWFIFKDLVKSQVDHPFKLDGYFRLNLIISCALVHSQYTDMSKVDAGLTSFTIYQKYVSFALEAKTPYMYPLPNLGRGYEIYVDKALIWECYNLN